ncbi:histidine kinase [Actinoplanes sp. ATCC 53533]|uniref:sensor histidine kinase n=1 Tax=Actinoplanes sp. ATCC 53533 TaxID=1288362 RepID=UPI000F791E8D|nr:histidine kinase [Actinoplanes sp. ATCC 53533]RSM48078.1 histidine kinase [Actinoplanes sp. ATCC 53533]
MPTRPSPALLVTIGAALVAALAAVVALGVAGDVHPVHITIISWLVLAYAGSGLIAWRLRPASALGPLMVLTGAGALAGALSWAGTGGVLHTVGQAVDVLPLVLFVQVFLTYPSGRLHGRAERLIVVTGWVAALAGQLAAMLLGGLRPHRLTVLDRPALATAVYDTELVVVSAVALAGVALLAVRRRTHGRPLRRSLSLLVDSFAVGLVMIAVLLLVGVLGGPAFPVVQRISLALLGVAPIAFLAGLLQARLARSSVGDLVVELRGDPADLVTPLARALRDPSLELFYWLPRFGRWTDAGGHPVTLPADPARVTLIDDDGAPMAALIHDPALRDEPALLAAVTAAAAIALRTGRLQAQLRANLEELRGSRARVVEAEQRARQRLERDLHDGAQQRLVALSLNLGILQTRIGADPEAAALLTQARTEIAVSLAELRDLARGLHPAVVSDHGLAVAVESLAARAPVPVRLTVDLPGRVGEAIEVAAYYVVCESLANIGKHAQATAATIEVSRTGGDLVVEIVDDGIGGADTERGTGLRGLADRVEALDGVLRVWTPSGGGTRVRADLPCG